MSIRNSRGFLYLATLSPRDRRALLLGAAVLVPSLLYVFGIKPYRAALQTVTERVAAEQELLERELELLASADELPLSIQRVQAEAQVYEERLVQAASGVLAEAELTDLLESLAFRSRVLLEEIRGGELERGEQAPPGLSVVRLHLRGESDLEGILSFLDEIERGKLLMRIRGLALEPEVARTDSDEENDIRRGPLPTGVVGFQLILDGFARGWEVGS